MATTHEYEAGFNKKLIRKRRIIYQSEIIL